jgi:hypothetical protein
VDLKRVENRFLGKRRVYQLNSALTEVPVFFSLVRMFSIVFTSYFCLRLVWVPSELPVLLLDLHDTPTILMPIKDHNNLASAMIRIRPSSSSHS